VNNKSDNEDSLKEEPKIFGVYIDQNNNKKFVRREFLKSAALLGASVALVGCSGEPSTVERSNNQPEKEATKPQQVENTPSQTPSKTSTKPANTPTKPPTKTSTKLPTQTEPAHATGEVNSPHNIFMGPSTDHPFIAKTILAEKVTILGKTSDNLWFKIKDSEQTIGWVFATYITVLTEITIPIIYDIPTPPAPVCDCVAYTPCDCDAYTPCDCDNYTAPCSCDTVESCSCDTIEGCSCDTICTCDQIHYWYPN
jgi:hypothetical protein